jgi:hypothetical protein
MQNSYDIARARKRENEIKVAPFIVVPQSPPSGKQRVQTGKRNGKYRQGTRTKASTNGIQYVDALGRLARN